MLRACFCRCLSLSLAELGGATPYQPEAESMPLDPKHLHRLLCDHPGGVTHAIVRDSATGAKSLCLKLFEHGGLTNPDPKAVAMRLYADYPHNKTPVYQLNNRDIAQSQIVEGELHIPHREVILTFFRLTYEPVPLPIIRTA